MASTDAWVLALDDGKLKLRSKDGKPYKIRTKTVTRAREAGEVETLLHGVMQVAWHFPWVFSRPKDLITSEQGIVPLTEVTQKN